MPSPKDEQHARFLRGEIAYPVDVADEIEGHLEDLATFTSREEWTSAIEAVYAVVGIHEEWLEQVASRGGGDHA